MLSGGAADKSAARKLASERITGQEAMYSAVPFGMAEVSSRLYTRSSVAIVGKLAVNGSVDDDQGV